MWLCSMEEKRERAGMGGISKEDCWDDGKMEREGDSMDGSKKFDG